MELVDKCPKCGSDQISSRWDAPRARMIQVCANCGTALLPTSLLPKTGQPCKECGWRTGHSPTCSLRRMVTAP